jgi:hypothetical protein
MGEQQRNEIFNCNLLLESDPKPLAFDPQFNAPPPTKKKKKKVSLRFF